MLAAITTLIQRELNVFYAVQILSIELLQLQPLLAHVHQDMLGLMETVASAQPL
jgi:hypothetical protein